MPSYLSISWSALPTEALLEFEPLEIAQGRGRREYLGIFSGPSFVLQCSVSDQPLTDFNCQLDTTQNHWG